MLIETKCSVDQVILEFTGGQVTVNIKGRIHPLAQANPDDPKFFCRQMFNAGAEDELVNQVVALVEREFATQLVSASETLITKEREEPE